jgi:uncharacterized protein YqeY
MSTTIYEQMRQRLPETLKDPVLFIERDLIRLLIGEADVFRARSKDGSVTDKQMLDLIGKSITQTQEAIDIYMSSKNPTQADELLDDMTVLLAWRKKWTPEAPKCLSVEETEAELVPVLDQIKAMEKEGAAMGLAMKHLKTTGKPVDGTIVKELVQKIRS